jgi:hypothetical protein
VTKPAACTDQFDGSQLVSTSAGPKHFAEAVLRSHLDATNWDKMSSSVPLQIAETIQTAHINRSPSARHDINPATAASYKEPVVLEEKAPLGDLEDLDGDDTLEDAEDEIPYSVLRPKRRSNNMPPLPDLRFEQSYLHSIAGATTWGRVAWITLRDQVCIFGSKASTGGCAG